MSNGKTKVYPSIIRRLRISSFSSLQASRKHKRIHSDSTNVRCLRYPRRADAVREDRGPNGFIAKIQTIANRTKVQLNHRSTTWTPAVRDFRSLRGGTTQGQLSRNSRKPIPARGRTISLYSSGCKNQEWPKRPKAPRKHDRSFWFPQRRLCPRHGGRHPQTQNRNLCPRPHPGGASR